MKNNIFIIFLVFLFFNPLSAESLDIQASSVSIDKKTKLAVFKDNVVVIDDKNNQFNTEYAEYNKKIKTFNQ